VLLTPVVVQGTTVRLQASCDSTFLIALRLIMTVEDGFPSKKQAYMEKLLVCEEQLAHLHKTTR
jgi:hypothetical protein